MSNVTLAIAGREYAVACAAGEEAHVARLGRMIDEKLATMPQGQPLNETRALLFAALLLADRVHELEQAEEQVEALQVAPVARERLAQLAERIEHLAESVEAGLENRRRRA